ncbi:hypothetical protein ACE02S_06680 [Shewanella xiamenensis]|uniref:hypothetical protein n=1 Tax=Shewanella xiamenensis TaxID=332186 RepID=UPI0035B93768
MGCNSEQDRSTVPPEVEVPIPPEVEVPIPVTLLTYLPAASEFGSSDASGAVALDEQFMIVADDEVNVLRVYPRQSMRLTSDAPLSIVKEWDFRGVVA